MGTATKKAKKPRLQAAMVDERRRITLPREIPPHSAVTIQQLDEYTFLVKRQRPDKLALVLIPVIEKLPDDPEWEKTEEKMARHSIKKLPPWKE